MAKYQFDKVNERRIHQIANYYLEKIPTHSEGIESIAQKYLRTNDYFNFVNVLDKRYRMDFFLTVEPYLDLTTKSSILACIWVQCESQNKLTYAEKKAIIMIFKNSDKSIVMDESELSIFNLLPNYVKIYRGVNKYNRHLKRSLSWTLNYDIAKSFAKRFCYDSTLEVWELTVPKSRVLCYFNLRSEEEVVVNLYRYDAIDSIKIINESVKKQI